MVTLIPLGRPAKLLLIINFYSKKSCNTRVKNILPRIFDWQQICDRVKPLVKTKNKTEAALQRRS